MRLADFILQHMDAILGEWDVFARSHEPAASGMDHEALRNHAAQMLKAFAKDLATEQSRTESVDKSQARGPASVEDSAATTHGEARLLSGFTIEQLLSEYRALRSSVLRRWRECDQRGAATDVDDIMRFNEAIDQAVAESVARYSRMINHSQHLFLAILGHDLRNPLSTTVIASSVLMHTSGLDPRHAEVAAKIHRSGLRMSKLVEDLIDYTRTHLGTSLPMAVKEANMADIANAAADELRMAYPDRIIDVRCRGNPHGVWDEGRIAQVCSNLLGNATQHGKPDAPITVTIEAFDAKVQVDVHNDGDPIDPEAIDTIFDPLIRMGAAYNGPTGHDTSLGIGLYIARAIVEAHGGEITATSDAEQGTTFRFTLPSVARPAPRSA